MPRRQRYEQDYDYAIGNSVTTLLKLAHLKVPMPDLVTYDSASTRYNLANAARVADGYAWTEWIWDIISLPHTQTLLEFLGSSSYKQNVYIRTTRSTGDYATPSASYEVFSCIMLRPILSGQEGTLVARSPYNIQNFKLRFVDLVIQPGYI